MKRVLISFCFVSLLLFYVNTSTPQSLLSVVPDTGSQGQMNFPVTLNGTGTEWTLSPYFYVYFHGGGTSTSNVVIVNDTTLTAILNITRKAPLGYRTVEAIDQYQNSYSKDSAFFVKMSIPAAPDLVYPPNNSQNILTNPVFEWDSNGAISTYRIQISTNSNFSSFVLNTGGIVNHYFQMPSNILQLSTLYYWRVNGTNILGTGPWSSVWNFRVIDTGLEKISSEIPGKFRLHNNYPNPFNPLTHIKFELHKNCFVKLIVYDILGNKITTLVNQKLNAGVYKADWSAPSEEGSNLASGIYFYRMETDNFIDTKRMVLLK